MTWRKIGFFESPTNGPAWRHSHCQLPTALVLSDKHVRVFYASRTAQQRSHIGFTDLLFGDNPESFTIGRVADTPVMTPGPVGHFDEHGVYPSCIVTHEGRHYMYFIGWNQGVEAPLFYASIGLALSDDGLNFERVSPAPIMSRSEHDPCLVTSPHVYIENGVWRMTYVSGIGWWRNEKGTLQSTYHIKSAYSSNGVEWTRHGRVAIDFESGETNLARSAVLKVGDADYRMWYSRVHRDLGKYRIGYAESTDGDTWMRKDALAGIGLDDSFAKEMICYPNVFTVGRETYMLYNGDGYGRAGFGIARLV